MTRLMNHLETERLILRPFTEQDAEALFAILSDRDVNTFLPMFPLKNLEEAKAYIKDKHAATCRRNPVILRHLPERSSCSDRLCARKRK